uniref:Uncharacterized protein n=1 Tax=Oryza rufipogon TaxID=4529 RepID=A0A0E0Q188_ORYRU
MDLGLASTPTSSAYPPRPWARCHRKLPAPVHLRLTISTFQSSMVRPAQQGAGSFSHGAFE